MAKMTGTTESNTRPNSKQARISAARQAVELARRRERRRQRLFTGACIGLVAAIAVAVGLALGFSRTRSQPAAVEIPSAPATTADGHTTNPPWPAPRDAAARVRAAGLPMLGEEGNVEHIHAHLDIVVDGRKVAVPANIGADEAAGKISPLHTHDGTGVIHIESPVRASFSLGQLFTEWQVSLGADHIGGLRVGDGKLLRAYVNGTPYEGDPAGIIFGAHDEIALVYGSADQQVIPPASYQFPKDE